MSTAGGFILDALPGSQAGLSSSDTSRRQDEDLEDSITLRKLTSKQESRLMNYLDEAFLQVNRGYNKRHNSATSSVPTLSSFLLALDAILAIIASIPPIGPSASLLVSYLLRFTNDVVDGIAGYEIKGEEAGDAPSTIDEQLQRVIEQLNLLDRVWSCVLRGQLVDLMAARKNVQSHLEESDDYFPAFSGNADQRADGDDGGSGRQDNIDGMHVSGRFPPAKRSKRLREGRTVIGSKAFATVAQTNRIRLRNVLTLGKENLFAWMRVQLDVPLPPRVETEQDKEEEEGLDAKLVNGETHLKAEESDRDSEDGEQIGEGVAGDAEGEEGEDDLEEVDTDGREMTRGTGVGETAGKEHSHYDELFDRKIDPDALDSDEEEPAQIGKRSRSPSQPLSARQARRLDTASHSPTRSSLPPADAESDATFSGTAAVMKWDVKFARLFAHTLRCLSDIQEHSNHREAGQRGADNDG